MGTHRHPSPQPLDEEGWLVPLRRPLVLITLIGAVVAIVGVIPVVQAQQDHARRNGFGSAVTTFASAWHRGRLKDVPYLHIGGDTVARQEHAIVAELLVPQDAPSRVQVVRADLDPGDDAHGTAVLAVTWPLAGHSWSYHTVVSLARDLGRWKVRWSPAVVNPMLGPGDVLACERALPPRAAVLDVTGSPTEPAGQQPGRPDGRTETIAVPRGGSGSVTRGGTTQEMTSASAGSASAGSVRSAGSGWASSVPVESVRGMIGPAGANQASGSGGRVAPGEPIGMSGLEARYDARLAGLAGVVVQVRHPGGTPSYSSALVQFPSVPGHPVRTTLDARVQSAATAALAASARPAAVVVLRVRTGEVLAAASSGPPGGRSAGGAISAGYPAGAGFLLISGYARARTGLPPVPPSPVPSDSCASTASPVAGHRGGRSPVPACAEVSPTDAAGVSDAGLRASSTALGYGADDVLGLAAFPGRIDPVPAPATHAATPATRAATPTTRAATPATGADEPAGSRGVWAGPLAAATTAASLAGGHPVTPRLVVDPAPQASRTRTPLDRSAVAAVRAMMRAMVTSGPASALAHVPGGPVLAVTGAHGGIPGTGRGVPSWTVGYQGDLAFAVVVPDGGPNGDAATAVTAELLRRLAGGGTSTGSSDRKTSGSRNRG